MVSATAYIMWCGAKNRLRRRLLRLREPRYMIGAVVGVLYLFFALYGRTRPRRPMPMPASPAAQRAQNVVAVFAAAAPSLAGLALLVAAAVSWLMPFSSGLLEFTAAETAFLFPAPVTRRQLLFYRLMRSQWAVFFGALVMSLAYPIATIPARVRGLLSVWLILMTAHVFFTGVTLSRPQIRERGAGPSLARFVMIAMFAALGVVVVAIGRQIWDQPILNLRDAYRVISRVAQHGTPHLVLLPFIALVRPLFALDWSSFLTALPLAVGVYVATIAWVLRADEAFGAITDQVSEAQASRPAKKRTSYQVRNVGWELALTGRPETPFLWKGAMQTFRIVDRRVLIRVGVMIAWLTMVVALFGRTRGLAQALGLLATFAAIFAGVIGPQILRVDLRQDLQHLEVLKTWPVRPAAVVRGEMLWPATVITTLAWVFGAVGIFLSAATFTSTPLSLRIAGGVAGLILAPAIIAAQFTIHNMAALLFPAWIPLGMSRPRGVDAMGQRLFMLGATWLMLALVVAPGAIAAGILWFAFRRLLGWWILIPAAAVCTSIVGFEVLMATEALGPAYERLDLTSVERGE